MAMGILGRKVGMTQIFDESGLAIPVTVIQAGPCVVLHVRTKDRDGYEAVQVGYLDKKRPADGKKRSRRSQASRSERGHVTSKLESKRSKKLADAGVARPAKAECEPKRFVREFRGAPGEVKVGDTVNVNVLRAAYAVDVTGVTKGRGYAGVIARHGFKGGRATHGTKKVHRHMGSVGMNSKPGHVRKGKRMAGHLGDVKVTARNLRLVRVDAQNDLLLVRGAVPGPAGGFVIVRETNRMPVSKAALDHKKAVLEADKKA